MQKIVSNQRLKLSKPAIIGTALAILAVLYSLLHQEEREHITSAATARSSFHKDSQDEHMEQRTTMANDLPPLQATKQENHGRQNQWIDTSWVAALSSPNEYHAVITLRNQRTQGSFARAYRILLRGCAGSPFIYRQDAIDSYIPRNSTDYQDRALALEKIRTHCNQFTADPDNLLLAQPLSGDSHGQRFAEARRLVSNPSESSATPKQIRAALTELAEQGHLDLATDYISASHRWRGQIYDPRGRDAELLVTAASFASERLAELESAPPEDIRRLKWCFLGGVCTAPFKLTNSKEFKSATPAEQQRILSVAADIEQAVRAGDIDALMGKP